MVEEKKEVKEYQLIKVPTGEAIAIQTPNGDVLTTEFALVEILNKLDRIERGLFKW